MTSSPSPPTHNPALKWHRDHLVVLLAVQDPQNSEKQVDDIEIKRDRRRNLLLHMIMTHHQLRVNQNIATKDQSRNPPIRQLRRAIVREESSHEPEQDQCPQTPEQIWHPRRKVVLGLTRKNRQRDKDAQRQDQRLQHDLRVVERRDHRDRIRLERREAAEEEQVGGVGFSLPEGQQHEADGAEERDPHHPLVALDPGLVAVAEEGDGAEDGGGEELDGSTELVLAELAEMVWGVKERLTRWRRLCGRTACGLGGWPLPPNHRTGSCQPSLAHRGWIVRATLKSSGTLSSSPLGAPSRLSCWLPSAW